MDNHPPLQKVSTIIVSRPGVMRQALQSALALFPHIEITGAVGGGLSALNLARKTPPALLIIDSGLIEDEMEALLSQIKQEQPQVRCLVLAETTRQKEAFMALGADAVALRNEPAEHLMTALDNMGLW